MLAQRPWLRVTLLVLAAAVILAAVGFAAYNLGAQSAADFGPRSAQIDRGDFDGPARGRRDQDSRSDFGGNLPQTFFRGNSLGSVRFGSPLAWLLRAAVGAAFLLMLVLGTVAFFRTGGWRPASGAEVVEAPKTRSKKGK